MIVWGGPHVSVPHVTTLLKAGALDSYHQSLPCSCQWLWPHQRGLKTSGTGGRLWAGLVGGKTSMTRQKTGKRRACTYGGTPTSRGLRNMPGLLWFRHGCPRGEHQPTAIWGGVLCVEGSKKKQGNWRSWAIRGHQCPQSTHGKKGTEPAQIHTWPLYPLRAAWASCLLLPLSALLESLVTGKEGGAEDRGSLDTDFPGWKAAGAASASLKEDQLLTKILNDKLQTIEFRTHEA